MFVVTYKPDGRCEYVGEVFSETVDRVRIQVCDAIELTVCGRWCLTDEIVEVDRSACRFFLTPEAAAEAEAVANATV